MDLISTAIFPVSLVLSIYMVISLFFATFDFATLFNTITLCVVILLPAILLAILRTKAIYFYWMLLYLLSLPIWQFWLPLYAFWHFDDFTWGETRKIQGESSDENQDIQELLSSRIPLRRWEEYERDFRKSIIAQRHETIVE